MKLYPARKLGDQHGSIEVLGVAGDAIWRFGRRTIEKATQWVRSNWNTVQKWIERGVSWGTILQWILESLGLG